MKDKKFGANIACISMLIGTAVAVLFATFSTFADECETTEDALFRLHVLANSDSDYDQGLKYRLRDQMMSYTSELFQEADNAFEAMNIAEQHQSDIEQYANQFLQAEGAEYTAKVEVTEMYFTTRKYENVTVPAGNYKALRILLGEAKGQNWWCVLYPPLCLPACSEVEPFISDELSRKIESTPDIEVRFALYEWIKKYCVG